MTSHATSGRSLPAHLRLPTSPVAHPDNVLTGGTGGSADGDKRWRITLLDEGLVRLQWSPSGAFEDRASQVVLHRDTPPVEMTVRENDRTLEVFTSRLHLTYDRGPFTPQGLSVQAAGGISTYHSVWRYGEQAQGNLGGTARTLDDVDGRCPLEDGIVSRYGVAAYDDSGSVLLTDDGWFAPREPGSLDLYVFCYGRDYQAALDMLYRISGRPPVVPRFALGNWWSRYHRYDADEYLALMDRFAAENIPLSVAVLDMDWHITDVDPRYGSGWTGYTWNLDLFPDPPAFLQALHDRGLAVTANVHPADGIRAHEAAYPQVAQALGIDPASELPAVFDATDPAFLTAYLEHVHHPMEEQGIDFWWLDWQSGHVSALPGLDPLWLLNHLHFLDAARPGGRWERRPMTFSRYAGLGSHRYPVGFSGDSAVTWDSLQFQPEFTATAANVGYGWWSHDIGGHRFGGKDDELATRWLQLGVFSPILRLHSTNDAFNTKEPWRFGETARRVMSRYLRLRHQLLPYLATAARAATEAGTPLVRPMYDERPWEDAAYGVPNQFRFGPSLLVAPVTERRDPVTLLAATRVWLPAGEWVDLMTGLGYAGDRTLNMYRDIDTLPVLARPGTILPLIPEEAVGNGGEVPADLEVWVVAGGSGTYTLAEDGDDDRWAFTELRYDGSGRLDIGAPTGDLASLPSERTWSLVLVGFEEVASVEVDGGGTLPVTAPRTAPLTSGPVPGSVRATLGTFPVTTGLTAYLGGDLGLARTDVTGRTNRILARAQMSFDLSGAVRALLARLDPVQAVLQLQAMDLPGHLYEALTEVILARPGAG